MKRLGERFGLHNKAYLYLPGKDILSPYLADKRIPGTYCVVLDVMQSIEKKSEGVTGGDIYRNYVLGPMMRWLKKERCVGVVIVPDTTKMCNRQKEMDYFRLGKRRIGKVPMIAPGDGAHVFGDGGIPSGDDWTSFKMNPHLRKQLNYYLCKRFSEQHLLPGIRGSKTVIFDNGMDRAACDAIGDPDLTEHFSLRHVYNHGRLVFQKKEEASGISEAELAMEYWWRKLEHPAPTLDEEVEDEGEGEIYEHSRTYDNVVLWTTDQDILNVVLLNVEDHEASPTRLIVYMETHRTRVNKLTMEKTTLWFCRIWDMKQLAFNICTAHRTEHGNPRNAILCEVLLMLLGGCDYHTKAMKGVGYALIHECLTARMADLSRMLRLRRAGFTLPITPEPVPLRIVDIDLEVYQMCVIGILRRKFAGWKKQVAKRVGPQLYVIPRQIMCTIAVYANVPRVRYRHGLSFMVDCLQTDAAGVPIWGYALGPVPGPSPDFLVVDSAPSVSPRLSDTLDLEPLGDWRI